MSSPDDGLLFGSAATELSSRRTALSFVRTRMAAHRTLMATMRSAFSFIGAGFGVAEARLELGDAFVWLGDVRISIAGLVLVLLGLGTLTWGVLAHYRFSMMMNRRRDALYEDGLFRSGAELNVRATLVGAFLLFVLGVIAAARILMIGFG